MKICGHRIIGFSLIASTIKWQTHSPYSHVSVVLRDGRVIEAREFEGVRILPALRVGEKERIDLFSIDGLTDAKANAIETFLLSQLGKPYDYSSIIRVFLFRKQERREAAGKWFCSELAYAGLCKGVTPFRRLEPFKVSPGYLITSPILTYEKTIDIHNLFGFDDPALRSADNWERLRQSAIE
jgi:hypothetical protein